MDRCIALALRGAGRVAPNPMVGAVLVYEDRVIGEGCHRQYGQAHAEVNCIESVAGADRSLIPFSTLYVSLEPCAHTGKTPPCADRIIKEKIPKVVIGCRDPFKEVNGKGIEKLKNAGVEVISGIREPECLYLNRRFFTFHLQHRPYVLLKWAQTADAKIASSGADRLRISNDYSNRMVHKWRMEEAAILVGTQTARIDNPELTNRYWEGPNPVRLVVDMNLSLAGDLHLFDKKVKTIVFNKHKHEEDERLAYYQLTEDVSLAHQLVHALYQLKILSVLVEGGARLLQSFIDEGYWDEARVITGKSVSTANGLDAPLLSPHRLVRSEELDADRIDYYQPVSVNKILQT